MGLYFRRLYYFVDGIKIWEKEYYLLIVVWVMGGLKG